ncbi:MAG: BON domain-containing protein [Sideroxyarcus sp.]|nr:BON domain-containing protein [Sideroxyarcus sp.]
MRNAWMLSVVILAGALSGCAQMGSIGGANSASERRTQGTVLDDQNIEDKAQQRIAEKYKSNVQVNVTCFNRYVLVTGQAPNEAAKMDIERIVGGIPPVKGIANELQVSGVSSSGVRSSDSGVTGDVYKRFQSSKAFSRDHIKVFTESGVVYLLGIVSRAEADAASEIASTTAGVQKVVRVFEYMD